MAHSGPAFLTGLSLGTHRDQFSRKFSTLGESLRNLQKKAKKQARFPIRDQTNTSTTHDKAQSVVWRRRVKGHLCLRHFLPLPGFDCHGRQVKDFQGSSPPACNHGSPNKPFSNSNILRFEWKLGYFAEAGKFGPKQDLPRGGGFKPNALHSLINMTVWTRERGFWIVCF